MFKVCSKCQKIVPISEMRKARGHCKKCDSARALEWYKNNEKRAKNTSYKRRYGITFEEYLLAHEKLGDKCEICFEKVLRLCVDHDHETLMVRGLLCHNCNAALGLLKDCPDVLEKAYRYLSKHKKSKV